MHARLSVHRRYARSIIMENTVSSVQMWEERVTIPTYPVGSPNKNPMFLEKRVYQGSSGVVYPHPVIERVSDEKEEREYNAIFLENRYIKIMLLPELGGRVQMALDKTNGYHFVYYNRVIKPALVGLTGPWISGGIEFNWPQHHRPSTFEPVHYRLQDNDDGSKTVWFSEIERMFRTKGMAGFTLHPDRAYLEIDVQLYNRTDFPQTFLWWANPAVHVSDTYQSVFPPDVYAVMDHGKRDVSSFPIATGTYYKMDYSPGTDISRYKNIPVPTSYMAYHSDFDFVGCYDTEPQAGMLHVANHHVVPGKKQWTWGNGDFGQAWDRQLTDEDGPYIELMCGAYTDNQPDFSWLQPGEEKRFTQVFMPYKRIGPPKSASKDVVLNLEINLERSSETSSGSARVAVYCSASRVVRVTLQARGQSLYDATLELDPETVLDTNVSLPHDVTEPELTLTVWEGEHQLLSYTPITRLENDVPAPVTPAKAPSELGSNEALFLNGLHLEQYRHATYQPEQYYLEAIERDPLDSRCNNSLGLLLMRRGKFADAESYFRTAIKSLTRRNPNPYDGEPFYNLGLSLQFQGRYGEAFSAFYKATWNAAWQDSAYFSLARILCRKGAWLDALALVERSLSRNTHHMKAHTLKIAILRHLGQPDAALQAVHTSLQVDPLDFGAMVEKAWLTGDSSYQEYIGKNVHAYIEIALDYTHAGLFEEAVQILREAPQTDPMVKYFRGWVQLEAGDSTAADASFAEAQAMSPDYCFPHAIEAVLALQAAMQRNPTDARAPYYLGNFWYAHRRYEEAIQCWERAAEADPLFPTVHRNLGLAYMNKLQDSTAARESYEKAFRLDPTDARVLFELDQLDKYLKHPPAERLMRLEQYAELVQQRDDLTIEQVTLLNLLGRYDEALAILVHRTFHPWEGGEGKVTAQYVTSRLEIAKRYLKAQDYKSAIRELEAALVYPYNLGEGKLAGARDNHIHFFLGEAYAGLGDTDRAKHQFMKASLGSINPTSPIYYNDQPPDMIFYQGIAHLALGAIDQAEDIFERLISYGRQHLNDDVKMDYFAVSLPDFLVFDADLNQRNRIHCHYMIALGELGLGHDEVAKHELEWVLTEQPDHPGAAIHRVWMNERHKFTLMKAEDKDRQ
jgi:tetratricopeptide (TPR) repeat protein